MRRSTSAGLAGFGLFAVFGIACVRSAGVVEAPMIDANASASALALAGRPDGVAPEDASADLPFKPGDRWTGTYSCRQGPTEMILTFEDVGRRDGDDEPVRLEATFEFHFDGSTGYAPSDGAARMRGTYDPRTKRLRLVGQEWIEQPQNYALINLVGTITRRGSGRHALSYAGTVEGPGCTSFTARPEEPLDLLDEAPGSRPQAPRSLPRPRP